MLSTVDAVTPLRETVKCPLCKSSRTTELYRPQPDLDNYGHLIAPYQSMTFGHVRCDECGTAFLQDRVRQENIAVFYAGEYHCFRPFAERGHIIATAAKFLARRRAREIGRYLKSERDIVLDYGCGSGTWIREFKELGIRWRMIGTDVVSVAVDLARKNSVEAYLADENTIADIIKPNSVRVIHMFHVIEHLPDPIDVLRKLRPLLTDDGIIIGQTPNIDSWDAKIFGRYWAQWHGPRHLVLYTPDTLRRHTEAAGYKAISIRSTPMSVSNWAASMLKAWALSRGREFHPTDGPIYPLLMLSMIPVVAVQMTVSYTGSIDFVLSKKWT